MATRGRRASKVMHYDRGMAKRGSLWLSVALVVTVAAALGVAMIRGGFSARDEPSRLETVVARAVRKLAVPARASGRTNPVALTPAGLAEARAHFADHCATCHGNDGSGQTEIGRSLYPKAPDMRLPATQSLSDGELYYVIQNGIRLTGMPAWGQKDDDAAADTWKLVHLIRRIGDLTPQQLQEMEAMNPKTPAEFLATSPPRDGTDGTASHNGPGAGQMSHEHR